MSYRSIVKENREFIINTYSQGEKFLVLVIDGDRMFPKFPFDSIEEAENWVHAIGMLPELFSKS